MASSTDVQVHSNTGIGGLASYRFMLTPSSALEVNYGIDYQNKMHYIISNTNNVQVTSRDQEASGAYVRSFVFRKWNPFVEGGVRCSHLSAYPQLRHHFHRCQTADRGSRHVRRGLRL